LRKKQFDELTAIPVAECSIENHFTVLGYLVAKQFKGKHVQEIRRVRADHIFWLIENVPEHPGLVWSEAQIMDIDAHYAEFKDRWCKQVIAFPDDVFILRNAAEAVLVEDKDLALKWLTHGQELLPNEPHWDHLLGLIYQLKAKHDTPDRHENTRLQQLSVHHCNSRDELRIRRNRNEPGSRLTDEWNRRKTSNNERDIKQV
jgi:hypothetical protein